MTYTIGVEKLPMHIADAGEHGPIEDCKFNFCFSWVLSAELV